MTSYETSVESSSAELVNISDPPCIAVGLVDIDLVGNFVFHTDVALLVFFLLSSFLQLYVIKSAVGHIRRGNGDQCLHVFLLSMTFGDLLLTALCYPLEVLPRLYDYHLPRLFNISVHFVTWVALSGSSLSLILLNLEKLIYFKYPLSYTSYVTRKRGVFIALITWMLSILFVSGSWFLECFNCLEYNCATLMLLPESKMMYILFSISVCVLPIVTSLLVGLYILKIVSSHRKKLAEEQALYSTNKESVSHAITSRLRTFYFIFMTTVFTAATLLPYRLYQIHSVFQRSSTPFATKKSCATLLEMWAMNYLISINAIFNPIITVTVLPQYRCRLFKRFFGSNCSDNKPTATEI